MEQFLASTLARTPESVSVRSAVSPSLIDERFDHDSCGVGFVASVQATATHTILEQALTALGRLAHRGATAADGKSSDGVGILAAVPREHLLREAGVTLAPEAPLGV